MDLTALLGLPPQGLAVFLLVLVRSSAIFLIAPVLGNANTPNRIKVGLSLLMALILTPLIIAKQTVHLDLQNPFDLVIVVGQELALGLLIGFLAQLLFVAMEFAGHVVGLQMGFSLANVFDPQTHAQIAVTSQFYLMVGVLVFLLLDGHHWVLMALERSFTTIPLGTFHLDGRAMGVLMTAANDLFWIALTLMAPVLGVLALAEISMAIVARIMPQMNVFVASFPVKIGLGVVTMALSFPLMVGYMATLTEQSFAGIFKFLGT